MFAPIGEEVTERFPVLGWGKEEIAGTIVTTVVTGILVLVSVGTVVTFTVTFSSS
jgi:hypothetical protein